MNLIVDNILDMIDECGESEVLNDLSAFSCPANPDIEHFLKHNAIEFAKKKMSITYLVSDVSDGSLLGYFTLTHKPIEIKADSLSNRSRQKLIRYSTYDDSANSYSLSAFLLAQFGKNYAVDKGSRITGDTLMEQVNFVSSDIQHRIGGGVMYLDVEDTPKLIHFYENSANYKVFKERVSPDNGVLYKQMIRFF